MSMLLDRLSHSGPSRGTLGAVAIASAAVGYGAVGPLSVLAADLGISSLWFVAGRALVGGLVLALVWRSHANPGLFRMASQRAKAAVILAGLLSAAGIFLIVSAIDRTSVAVALLVFYTYPVVVAVGASLLSQRHLSVIGWIAIVGALVGVILVVGTPTRSADPVGIVLALMSASCGAGFVMLARYAYSSIPAAQAASALLLVAGTAAMVAGIASGGASDAVGLGELPAQGLLVVAIAGVLSAAIPTPLFVTGVRIVGAPRAVVLSMIEPAAGVFLGAVLVGQIPSGIQVAGGLLVIVGSVFARARSAVIVEHVP